MYRFSYLTISFVVPLPRFGDGLCCRYGRGSYSLEMDGQGIFTSDGNTGASEVTVFTPSLTYHPTQSPIIATLAPTHAPTASTLPTSMPSPRPSPGERAPPPEGGGGGGGGGGGRGGDGGGRGGRPPPGGGGRRPPPPDQDDDSGGGGDNNTPTLLPSRAAPKPSLHPVSEPTALPSSSLVPTLADPFVVLPETPTADPTQMPSTNLTLNGISPTVSPSAVPVTLPTAAPSVQLPSSPVLVIHVGIDMLSEGSTISPNQTIALRSTLASTIRVSTHQILDLAVNISLVSLRRQLLVTQPSYEWNVQFDVVADQTDTLNIPSPEFASSIESRLVSNFTTNICSSFGFPVTVESISTAAETQHPTILPTELPSELPSSLPSASPSYLPSVAPTHKQPTPRNGTHSGGGGGGDRRPPGGGDRGNGGGGGRDGGGGGRGGGGGGDRPPRDGGGGDGRGGDRGGDGRRRCRNKPCATALLGDVGFTTATGTDSYSGELFRSGEEIFGPFMAGFGRNKIEVLVGLGCNSTNTAPVSVAAGIDTSTVEAMVAYQCGIELPRVEGDEYIGLLNSCGGHTAEHHFHEKLGCLYEESGAHSSKIGETFDRSQDLFGKWENYSAGEYPVLDACGGHYGITPDSDGSQVYHYHVQSSPPFTFGCYGPNEDGSVVTQAQCEALYDGCASDAETAEVTTSEGTFTYRLWCPCWANTSPQPSVSPRPSGLPSATPSRLPSTLPTEAPSSPSQIPTELPSSLPTVLPSSVPTQTASPTALPSVRPSSPSLAPTIDVLTSEDIAAIESAISSAFGLSAAGYGIRCAPCTLGDAVGGLVRLAFHDAAGGSGRVDGCIDVTEPANAGLEPIVTQLHETWLPFAEEISFADTVVLAGNLAVRVATTTATRSPNLGHVGSPDVNNGPLVLPFRSGRPDTATPFTCDDSGRLPSNTLSWASSQQFFATRFNLTATEIVALFGAHSVGRAEAANSGIDGGWTAFQSSLSTLYYRELVEPRWDKITAQDWRDNQNHLQLTSDVELVVSTTGGPICNNCI